ncbi:CidA/LrgA family protein [Microbacteriaceae bacterium K1510]|nr:CidA/LrgA family protein [Microbacteriaceae bacterium K1510]
MSARSIRTQVRRFIHRRWLAQVGLVCAFWFIGQMTVQATGLPVPGGVIGMLVVLALLATRRLSVFSMRRGSEWFLAEMMLFFVPAVLALLDHGELLGLLGLKVLAVIVGGTIAVMAVTGLTVDLCCRWTLRHAASGPAIE